MLRTIRLLAPIASRLTMATVVRVVVFRMTMARAYTGSITPVARRHRHAP
jgi:hypothetical protein